MVPVLMMTWGMYRTEACISAGSGGLGAGLGPPGTAQSRLEGGVGPPARRPAWAQRGGGVARGGAKEGLPTDLDGVTACRRPV